MDAARDIAPLLAGAEDQLDGPGVDADRTLHRDTYRRVLTGLGLDDELVTSLYDVECEPAINAFADDAASTVRRLKDAGSLSPWSATSTWTAGLPSAAGRSRPDGAANSRISHAR